MYYFEVAPTQIVRKGSDTFTYRYTNALSVGTIVECAIGKKTVIGVIMRVVLEPTYETKPIEKVVEQTPLPGHLISTAVWIADYYSTPLATVLQTVLPRGVAKTRRSTARPTPVHKRKRTTIVFTPDQKHAIDKAANYASGATLLHGVTGSGKTSVYIELAKKVVDSGRSVIVLVPEIALTSQLVAEFAHHFDDITVAHSKLTEAERHLAWKGIIKSTSARVIIGPRSALFMPVSNLGLIVIDECHEPSFKQEQSPRYSALRVASVLANAAHAKVILGSATPLVSDYYLAAASKHPILSMPVQARTDTVKPTVSVIDMTKRTNFKRHRFLSDTLLKKLEDTFASGKQALIFHNRRGTASSTLCENCGWQAGCPRCYIPLTLHADAHHLRCHICAYSSKVPTSCPECGNASIIHKGIGTKLIETELRKLFPDISMMRFDGDSETTETVEKKYSELYDGNIQLIIGTQVIAKGLDLPHLRTVGIVQADAGLSMPDYTAPERTFQLLAQVVGRVGRSHHPTDVIVQSYQPAHPAVVDGISQNYTDFYTRTIALRKHTLFPPFCYLLKLTCTYKTEAAAIKNARAFAETLRSSLPHHVEVLGPAPAFYERIRDSYRWQLVIKSKKREDLVKIVPLLPPKYWQFELDPLSLL